MNKSNRTILIVALLMIGGAALGINAMKAHQRLSPPGIITKPIPGSQRLDVYLPENVLDYQSIGLPTDKNMLIYLPQDTSFRTRQYRRNEDVVTVNVVLMGADRTSIHKPQFCLRGQGWDIDAENSASDTVRVESPHPYDLPVMKLVNSRDFNDKQGNLIKVRGIYVYWFVADHDLTADHWTRMRKMATHLLRTGELERWAYVSCFSVCLPGNEDATYARMKKFIAAAVPQFQLTVNPSVASLETPQTASR
ncbi:MAG TPA: exosortase-associated EpsI family protein [Verrucomicrobiae bacterium]|jgi:hypothetical protein|nr:exosortase-associated EpsI family protein [Verrucomicrobiae bacterium]